MNCKCKLSNNSTQQRLKHNDGDRETMRVNMKAGITQQLINQRDILIKTKTEECSTIEGLDKSIRKENIELSDDIFNLKQDVDEVRADNLELVQMIDDTEDKNLSLTSYKEKLDNKIAENYMLITQVEKDIEALTQIEDDLTFENQSLQNEKAAKKKHVRNLTAMNEELQKELEDIV